MFKTFAQLFLFLALLSCHKDEAQPVSELTDNSSFGVAASETQPAQLAASTTSQVPKEALSWNAEIYYVNFSSKDQAKVEEAVALMKKVIASQEFKDAVINHHYKGEKTYVDNNGLSNEEIYQKILDGAEVIGMTSKNNTLDVELELYQQATTTIGYTYPDTIRIWMNTKYFHKYTAIKVAGNLMHEWMHKLGFGHAMKHSRDRDFSVPYAIGYLMDKLAKNL